jgi:hypothetical protein
VAKDGTALGIGAKPPSLGQLPHTELEHSQVNKIPTQESSPQLMVAKCLTSNINVKTGYQQGMVAYTYNPSTQEAQAEGPQVRNQPGSHGKSVSKQNNNINWVPKPERTDTVCITLHSNQGQNSHFTVTSSHASNFLFLNSMKSLDGFQ